MQVMLNEELINVRRIDKNNKNIYFRIIDNEIVVTCNKNISEKNILKIIKENEKAIYNMYQKQIKNNEDDKFFNYLGKKYIIVYDKNITNTYFDDDFIFTKDKKSLEKFYQKECLRIFEIEIEKIKDEFEDKFFFTWKTRKMKTRWGVNNVTKKVITLNSELLKKEPHLIDYVIIHEMCHFYEANHSSRFWDKVKIYYPNYKQARKELRGS